MLATATLGQLLVPLCGWSTLALLVQMLASLSPRWSTLVLLVEVLVPLSPHWSTLARLALLRALFCLRWSTNLTFG